MILFVARFVSKWLYGMKFHPFEKLLANKPNVYFQRHAAHNSNALNSQRVGNE